MLTTIAACRNNSNEDEDVLEMEIMVPSEMKMVCEIAAGPHYHTTMPGRERS